MLVMFADRLQRLAATAPHIGAVQEAVGLAFPPSQGSAKRAEKFKQFCSDVLPPGTKLKVPALPHLNASHSQSGPLPRSPPSLLAFGLAVLQHLGLHSRLTKFDLVIYSL